MTPHPGIRKTIKWGGAALTVLLVVVWIKSGWWPTPQTGPGWSSKCGISAGGVFAGDYSVMLAKSEIYFPLDNEKYDTKWWFGDLGRGPGWRRSMPLWIPALASLLVTIAAWRLDTLARRRAKLNLCPKCRYDRTGLRDGASGPCPECGTSPASAAS